jgi:hypothetical protein
MQQQIAPILLTEAQGHPRPKRDTSPKRQARPTPGASPPKVEHPFGGLAPCRKSFLCNGLGRKNARDRQMSGYKGPFLGHAPPEKVSPPRRLSLSLGRESLSKSF